MSAMFKMYKYPNICYCCKIHSYQRISYYFTVKRKYRHIDSEIRDAFVVSFMWFLKVFVVRWSTEVGDSLYRSKMSDTD